MTEFSTFGGRAHGAFVEHLVDQPVLDRRLGVHEVVAVGVALDLLDRLAGVLRQISFRRCSQLQDLAGVDVDVRRLALEAAATAGGS